MKQFLYALLERQNSQREYLIRKKIYQSPRELPQIVVEGLLHFGYLRELLIAFEYYRHLSLPRRRVS